MLLAAKQFEGELAAMEKSTNNQEPILQKREDDHVGYLRFGKRN